MPGVEEPTTAAYPDALTSLVDPETPELRAYLDSDTALGASALFYAEHGWPVFPVAAGGKVPVTPNGCLDATTDVDVVREWWRTMPSCNIGVATGFAFDVIDIDAPDGFTSWAEFVEGQRDAGRATPGVLASSRTGSGGAHLLVAPVPGARNGTGLGGKRGLDYRATGGYICAPPSRLHGGARYVWTLVPDHRLLRKADQ